MTIQIQYTCKEQNQNFQRTVEANAVPQVGNAVSFEDAGRFVVESTEQRFSRAGWSETGYEEKWYIALVPYDEN